MNKGPDTARTMLQSLTALAERRGRDATLELYARRAERRSIERCGDVFPERVGEGSEEGITARVDRRERGGIALASATGAIATVGTAVIERAERSPGEIDPGGAPWARELEGEREDHDDDVELPPIDRSRRWLDEATAAVEAVGGIRVARAWYHVASTTEAWVGEGWCATRRRCRAWAVAEIEGERLSVRRPLRVAARHWSALDVGGWAEELQDRMWPSDEGAAPRLNGPVLLAPSAAAAWIRAWADARRSAAARIEPRAGVRLVDDPTDPAATMGGRFDDVGMTSAPADLAGVEPPPLDGCARRPALGDRPRRAAAHLVVEAGRAEMPDDAEVVLALQLLPGNAGRLRVVVDGGRLRGGRPAWCFRGHHWEVDAGAWLRRCVGTVGPVRHCYGGVTTPALLLGAERVGS